MALLIRETEQNWNDPTPAELCKLQWKEPIYLTSGCCENAWGSEELFALLNLEPGKWEDKFYPLTDGEAQFIAEEGFEVDDKWWYIAYTGVFEGRKWLMPVCSFHFCQPDYSPESNKDDPTPDVAEVTIWREHNRIEDRVKALGGKIFADLYEEPDRHNLRVLLPFEVAAQHATNYESYKTWLTDLLR